MKRIVLTVALLLGGTAVAHANPPGLTPGPAPQGAPNDQLDARGGWDGPRARGPGRAQRGPRGQRAGTQRIPPQLRARLIAMFDRDHDGRLEGPERRAAKRFVKKVLRHRQARQGFGPQGGPRGGGRQGGPRGGQGF